MIGRIKSCAPAGRSRAKPNNLVWSNIHELSGAWRGGARLGASELSPVRDSTGSRVLRTPAIRWQTFHAVRSPTIRAVSTRCRSGI